MAYESKQYAVAVDMLQKEYKAGENQRSKGKIAYMLGESYKYLEENDLAIRWLQNSVEQDYGNEALLSLAEAYKKKGDYSSSIKAYEALKSSSNADRQIDREIYVLKEVIEWSKESDENISIKMMEDNSAFSEYAPALLDENLLVFTSDRDESTGGESYGWTGNKTTDIFVKMKNGSVIKRFDATINSDHNDGTAAFTSDGMEMVFSRCFTEGENDGFCKLMYSERSTGLWSTPVVLPFLLEGINYGQPTFIENDSVLVFTAKIESGAGGHDLYYVEKILNDDGSIEWGEAYIFPQTVNSKGNEMFPTGDGDTLYFSSDYLAGYGGLDIFKTWLQPNGQWAPPQNLKKPINSSYDDFSFIVDYNAKLRGSEIQRGYFASNRNGYGKEDIYSFQKRKSKETEVVPPVVEEKEVLVDIYLAGKTKEISFEDPQNPNSAKIGKSILQECYVVISDGKDEEKIYSDDKGQFILQLKKDKDYTIKASKVGYLNAFANVSTKNLSVEDGQLSTTINTELVLNKIFSNVEIVLENIYYNFNKSDIREDAKPTLDSLTRLMKDNPQIEIQLSSHTDCRGDEEYNQILSQKRAESAVQYMTSNGVDKKRMIAKGFGQSMFSVDCLCDDCTEEQHQKNRRTTFKILE